MIIDRKTKKQILIIILAVIVVAVVSGFYLDKVYNKVTIEAGLKAINVNQFIRSKKVQGTFATDLSTINLNVPSSYEIEILIDKKITSSRLIIKDTIAPEAESINQEIAFGSTIEAKAFVRNIVDITDVTVSYKEQPDYDLVGEQEVKLILVDTSNNKTEINAILSIGKVFKEVSVEIGSKSLDIADFMMSSELEGTFVGDLSKIDLNVLNNYEVVIKMDEEEYLTKVAIIDTIQPKATTVNQVIWANEAIEASTFVKNITDFTEVNISYEKQPDFAEIGSHEVVIILEDTSGNISKVDAELNIKEDTKAPMIEGISHQIVYIGDAISYKKGVKVTDNKDEKIELVIDTSDVNLKKEGLYHVIYTAIDKAGNTASETVDINVKEKPLKYVDPAEVDQLADGILLETFNDGMSEQDKLWAIFEWTKNHITYTGYSDKKDWIQGAVRGIKRGTGDCFTYYATARELLTRAGFENKLVTRFNGTHFWNLVKYEDEWYHFDTCPWRSGYKYLCFLRTDTEILEYSEWCEDYYKFDAGLNPPTPLQPLILDAR